MNGHSKDRAERDLATRHRAHEVAVLPGTTGAEAGSDQEIVLSSLGDDEPFERSKDGTRHVVALILVITVCAIAVIEVIGSLFGHANDEVLWSMLGLLETAVGGVVGYYFGNKHGKASAGGNDGHR